MLYYDVILCYLDAAYNKLPYNDGLFLKCIDRNVIII